MKLNRLVWILLSLFCMATVVFIVIATGLPTKLFPDKPQLSEDEVIATTRQWVLDYGETLRGLTRSTQIPRTAYDGEWKATYIGDECWHVTSEFFYYGTKVCSFDYFENTSIVNYKGMEEISTTSPQIIIIEVPQPTPPIPGYLVSVINIIFITLGVLLIILLTILVRARRRQATSRKS